MKAKCVCPICARDWRRMLRNWIKKVGRTLSSISRGIAQNIKMEKPRRRYRNFHFQAYCTRKRRGSPKPSVVLSKWVKVPFFPPGLRGSLQPNITSLICTREHLTWNVRLRLLFAKCSTWEHRENNSRQWDSRWRSRPRPAHLWVLPQQNTRGKAGATRVLKEVEKPAAAAETSRRPFPHQSSTKKACRKRHAGGSGSNSQWSVVYHYKHSNHKSYSAVYDSLNTNSQNMH